jgi:hypothetical protein
VARVRQRFEVCSVDADPGWWNEQALGSRALAFQAAAIAATSKRCGPGGGD